MTEQTATDSILAMTAIFCVLLAGATIAAVLYLAITLAAQYTGSFLGQLG